MLFRSGSRNEPRPLIRYSSGISNKIFRLVIHSFSTQVSNGLIYGDECECDSFSCPEDPDNGEICGGSGRLDKGCVLPHRLLYYSETSM